MPKLLRFAAFLILAGTLPKLHGQDPKADIQKKLASEFVLTKVTADRTDIVAAGSTLTLHKDGLLMWSVDTKFPPTRTESSQGASSKNRPIAWPYHWHSRE